MWRLLRVFTKTSLELQRMGRESRPERSAGLSDSTGSAPTEPMKGVKDQEHPDRSV